MSLVVSAVFIVKNLSTVSDHPKILLAGPCKEPLLRISWKFVPKLLRNHADRKKRIKGISYLLASCIVCKQLLGHLCHIENLSTLFACCDLCDFKNCGSTPTSSAVNFVLPLYYQRYVWIQTGAKNSRTTTTGTADCVQESRTGICLRL